MPEFTIQPDSISVRFGSLGAVKVYLTFEKQLQTHALRFVVPYTPVESSVQEDIIIVREEK